MLVAAAFVAAWFIYRRAVTYDVPAGAASPDPVVAARTAPGAPTTLGHAGATLTWSGRLAVLRAAGDPHALGEVHGRLLGAAVAEVAESFRPTIDHAVAPGGLLGGLTRDMRIAWRHRFVDDGVPDIYRASLAGVARGAVASGARVSYDDLLRDQASLDVGVPARWTDEDALRHPVRALTFVAPRGGALASRLWVGRTFALPGLGDGGEAVAAHPVVSFVRPSGRLAWAGVGWPGLVGVVTGVNAEGLVVTVQPARTAEVRPTRAARPVALLARDILETCATLDQAIQLVEATPTLGAAALVVVDGKDGKWAVLERGPVKRAVLRAPTEPAVGDVLAGQPFADDPENDRNRRVLPTGLRLRRAAHLLRAPLADAAAAVAVLRDERAPDDAPLPAGHRGAIYDPAAVQTVLIDPGGMALWVADGDARGRFRAFDLRHELRGEGDRPAPAADVPAEADVDVSIVPALRAARADLREARRRLGAGDVRGADEWVQRAIARAPTLPEAWKLAGDVARSRGDRPAAVERWRRWLELGPDDPGAEEAIRALVAP